MLGTQCGPRLAVLYQRTRHDRYYSHSHRSASQSVPFCQRDNNNRTHLRPRTRLPLALYRAPARDLPVMSPQPAAPPIVVAASDTFALRNGPIRPSPCLGKPLIWRLCNAWRQRRRWRAGLVAAGNECGRNERHCNMYYVYNVYPKVQISKIIVQR